DPGSDEPPIMRYYVWDAQSESFDGYTINKGEAGAGLQIRTADLDADGDVDIVVAGKDGTQILFNQRR
ncbi:MAG: VCBS repeat-containing protein, partial [Planctomycetota bacterium]